VSHVSTLDPHETARLTEFARACKAAARAVVLYPDGHPAITSTLARIADVTSPGRLPASMRVRVLADSLLVDDRAPARPDASLAELAALLHAHLIGELVVHPGGNVAAWCSFLQLLGQAPDAVRAKGGIGALWAASGGPHVEVREIDFSEVLRERTGGLPAAWEDVVKNCLHGDVPDLKEDVVRALIEAGGDAGQLATLARTIETRSSDAGSSIGTRTAAVLRLLSGIVTATERQEPERLDVALDTMAAALGELSPEMIVSLAAARRQGHNDTATLVDKVIARVPDGSVAQLVARHALDSGTPIERVAQAFHALVRDSEQQERLLALAHDQAAASPLGATDHFEQAWDQVAQKLLTSYTDEQYVSDDYGHELSVARTRAITVEDLDEDPPERLTAWRETVATSELRRLDLALVLDLLRIEDDEERRANLVGPVVALVEDLSLVGDFEAAQELLTAIVSEGRPLAAAPRGKTARSAVDRMIAGPLLRHVAAHLDGIDDTQFERVKTMCTLLGEPLVRPLAEMIATEERSRSRERLMTLLVAFGAAGRKEVERLKSSSNPAVRRAAVYLLREFGGSEALPELAELLSDSEPHVRRDAVRAILRIGTDHAYRVLEQALTRGTEESRELIMQALSGVRDERAAPLFAYFLRHVDHRGSLRTVYLHAIESLGALKDPQGVPALKDALYRGEWWAPRRTAQLRGAAGAALARIGTSDAQAVLQEAIKTGPRGVRAAAARSARNESRIA
jgi:HEAT repeat protein